MEIRIRFFGRYRDIIGKDEVSLPIGKGDTIETIVDRVFKQYPNIEKEKKLILVSRNNIYTSRETIVQDGDVLMFSPPIVGGG